MSILQAIEGYLTVSFSTDTFISILKDFTGLQKTNKIAKILFNQLFSGNGKLFKDCIFFSNPLLS